MIDSDFLQWMRDANDFARQNGYAGGVPTFHVGAGGVRGTLLLPGNNGNVVVRDIPLAELAFPNGDYSVAARFRAVDGWSRQNGYEAGFPNGHQAIVNGAQVVGACLIKPAAQVFKDLIADELGNPPTIDDRFTAMNTWAYHHGYVGAVPTMQEAIVNGRRVFGARLFSGANVDFEDLFDYGGALHRPGTPANCQPQMGLMGVITASQAKHLGAAHNIYTDVTLDRGTGAINGTSHVFNKNDFGGFRAKAVVLCSNSCGEVVGLAGSPTYGVTGRIDPWEWLVGNGPLSDRTDQWSGQIPAAAASQVTTLTLVQSDVPGPNTAKIDAMLAHPDEFIAKVASLVAAVAAVVAAFA